MAKSSKPAPLSATVRYAGHYGALYAACPKSRETLGTCGLVAGSALSMTGHRTVNGVVYRVTVEPLGATINAMPEPWMYTATWAGQREVTRARKTLRGKSRDEVKAREHARAVLARWKQGKAWLKADITYYARMLALRQFPAVDA